MSNVGCQLDTLGRENLNLVIDFTRLSYGHIHGAFSYLLIDIGVVSFLGRQAGTA